MVVPLRRAAVLQAAVLQAAQVHPAAARAAVPVNVTGMARSGRYARTRTAAGVGKTTKAVSVLIPAPTSPVTAAPFVTARPRLPAVLRAQAVPRPAVLRVQAVLLPAPAALLLALAALAALVLPVAIA